MLSVIKASAGSGKTHRLTYEYLKLILPHPLKYKHVLAVTFTNKATAEMKTRIIEELDLLASSPTQSGYLDNLSRDLLLSQDEIQNKASEALVAILFDYGHFNVSTIDSFFQQAIRSFIRELGIHGGFSLEMNSKIVLQAAVDRIFLKLDEGEHKQLFQWLTEYYLSRSEEGKSWNVKTSIVKLSEQLLKESYKTLLKTYQTEEKVLNSVDLELYRKKLLTERKSYETELKTRAKNFIESLNQNGLQLSDLKGRSFDQLTAIAAGTRIEITEALLKAQQNEEAWYTKKSPNEIAIRSFFQSNGATQFDCLIDFYRDKRCRYLSIIHILKNIFALGILADVAHEIDEYSKENNLILMSKSAELLNGLIDGSSTPFIYEKIALFIEHYMIDEFQDTSDLQWSNFSPLVTEALDQRGQSLIVGDVKQSIYRWRDSNWKLLGEVIPEQFKEQIELDNLTENWRSGRHIIAFNNEFFSKQTAQLAEVLIEQFGQNQSIGQVYNKELHQTIPEKNSEFEGHLRIELFDVDNINKEEEQEINTKRLTKEQYQKIALDRLANTILSLNEKGFRRGDIGILVRTNREAQMVVASLLEYKQQNPQHSHLFELVSQEGLLIDHAQSISLIVGLLHFLHDPDRKIYQLFSDKEGRLIETMPHIAPDAEQIQQLRTYPLFELCEQIVHRFIIDDYPDEIAFIEAFLDLVHAYSSDRPTDLKSFLDWWETERNRRTLSSTDVTDALQVMTVHASKGLGFEAVIVPFATWELANGSRMGIVWCEPLSDDLKINAPLPIKGTNELEQTEFAIPFKEELMQTYIDSLNVAYVAFTRAKQSLTIYSQLSGKPDERKSISDLITLYVQSNIKGEKCWEMGDNWHKEKRKKGVTKRRITQLDDQEVQKTIICIPLAERVHIKSNATASRFYNNQQRMGVLLHDLMSHIVTYSDIDYALRELQLKEVLHNEEIEALELQLHDMLQHPIAQKWFDGSSHVINERDLLVVGGKTIRPDRVLIYGNNAIVIDYKFGKRMPENHGKQVKEYMDQLSLMGFDQVDGYLWYPLDEDPIVHIQ